MTLEDMRVRVTCVAPAFCLFGLAARYNIPLVPSCMQVELVDLPMEAWLQHIHPLWIDERIEQERRQELLRLKLLALAKQSEVGVPLSLSLQSDSDQSREVSVSATPVPSGSITSHNKGRDETDDSESASSSDDSDSSDDENQTDPRLSSLDLLPSTNKEPKPKARLSRAQSQGSPARYARRLATSGDVAIQMTAALQRYNARRYHQRVEALKASLLASRKGLKKASLVVTTIDRIQVQASLQGKFGGLYSRQNVLRLIRLAACYFSHPRLINTQHSHHAHARTLTQPRMQQDGDDKEQVVERDSTITDCFGFLAGRYLNIKMDQIQMYLRSFPLPVVDTRKARSVTWSISSRFWRTILR